MLTSQQHLREKTALYTLLLLLKIKPTKVNLFLKSDFTRFSKLYSSLNVTYTNFLQSKMDLSWFENDTKTVLFTFNTFCFRLGLLTIETCQNGLVTTNDTFF